MNTTTLLLLCCLIAVSTAAHKGGKKHKGKKSHSSSSEGKRHNENDHVCSVLSHYWLSGINEKRSCHNTANSNQPSCKNCCISVYLDDNEKGDQKDVQAFIAEDPSNKDNTQCVCCSPKTRRHYKNLSSNSNHYSSEGSHSGHHSSEGSYHHSKEDHCAPLKPLNWPELVEYIHAYDDSLGEGSVIAFGKAKFTHTSAGLVITCQCKPATGVDNWCSLEFDNGVDSFVTKNSTAFNANGKANGEFDLITSASIKIACDKKSGSYVVNGTTATHYTCYSGHDFHHCVIPDTGNVCDEEAILQ